MSPTSPQPEPDTAADPAVARRQLVLSELTNLCMDAARLSVAQAKVMLSEGVAFDAEALSRALAGLSRAVRLTLALQERFLRPPPAPPSIPAPDRAPAKPCASWSRYARSLDAEPREDLRPREQLVEFEAGVIDRPAARSAPDHAPPEPQAPADADEALNARIDRAISRLRFKVPGRTSPVRPNFGAVRGPPIVARAAAHPP